MISTTVRIAGSLGLAVLMAGCGSSPPNHFYRLTAAGASIGTEQQPSLGIGPIEIPEFLNRNAIVYSGGGNRLEVIGNERWAEPLGEGVQRVLGLNLAGLLDSENLSYFPWDARREPEYDIRVSVLDLDAEDGRATLVADWLLYRPGDGATIAKRISSFSKPLPAGAVVASDLPTSYSALLYELSATIADAIREEQDKHADAKAQ